MKQTAFESLKSIIDQFPETKANLERHHGYAQKHMSEIVGQSDKNKIDAANLALSLWEANPNLVLSDEVVENLFSCMSSYRYRLAYYPNLSNVKDTSTRGHIVQKIASNPEESIFLHLDNFTREELASTISVERLAKSIFKFLTPPQEIVGVLNWLYDGDTEQIVQAIAPLMHASKMYDSRQLDTAAALDTFIQSVFNDKLFNELYVMSNYSTVKTMLSGLVRVDAALRTKNPYLVHASFRSGDYSNIFDNKKRGSTQYTDDEVRFFSVLYACEIYSGGGRRGSQGSIPGYMKCKDRLGDLYQPLKSMLDSGYNFAQIYNRIKHRFTSIFN